MFEGKSFFEILSIGGWTLYLLLVISIISISIIMLKIIEFSIKSKVHIESLMLKIRGILYKL